MSNRETEQAIERAIGRAMDTAGASLMYEATADLGAPVNTQVTVMVERSSYDLSKTQITVRLQTTVRQEPKS